MRHIKGDLLVGVLLTALTFLVFGQALRADFVPWDDDINLYANPHHGSLSLERIHWMFTDLTYQWRYQPLSWLTWSLIHTLWGLDPFGYHLANLLLHSANAFLVFLLVRKILRLAAGAGGNLATTVCAAVAAGVWALHPLRVEVVAWAVELLYCQALFFLLVSLLCYCEAMTRATKRAGWYWASVAAFAASLLSFPLALGYLGVLLVADVFLFRKLGPGHWLNGAAWQAYREKAPFALVTLVVAGINFYSRSHAPGWTGPVSLEEFSLLERVMQAFYIWAYYAWKPWAPVDLSPVDTRLIWFQPGDWPFVLSAAGVVAVSVMLLVMRHRWPLALGLWLCHLALLVPLLGLTEHPHYPSDRYSVAVGICWSVLAGWILWKLWERRARRYAALGVTTVLLAVLAVMSQRQTRIWQNGEVLLETVLQRLGDDPYRADIHHRLGRVWAAQENYARAEEHLRAAVQLRPDRAGWHYDFFETLSAMGKRDEALAHAQQALRLDSNLPDLRNSIGVLLARQGQTAEAAKYFSAELELNPGHHTALANLALAQAQLGEVDSAKASFTRAMNATQGRIAPPQQIMFFQSIAAAFARRGQWAEALASAQAGLAIAQRTGQFNLAQILGRDLERYRAEAAKP
ncbi:MAG: tetratricopeptide repeat protein [Verrucomicrobiota bacterium]